MLYSWTYGNPLFGFSWIVAQDFMTSGLTIAFEDGTDIGILKCICDEDYQGMKDPVVMLAKARGRTVAEVDVVEQVLVSC